VLLRGPLGRIHGDGVSLACYCRVTGGRVVVAVRSGRHPPPCGYVPSTLWARSSGRPAYAYQWRQWRARALVCACTQAATHTPLRNNVRPDACGCTHARSLAHVTTPPRSVGFATTMAPNSRRIYYYY